jgi:hypothetical protein
MHACGAIKVWLACQYGELLYPSHLEPGLGRARRSNHHQPLKHDPRILWHLSPSVAGKVMSFIRWRQMYKGCCAVESYEGLHDAFSIFALTYLTLPAKVLVVAYQCCTLPTTQPPSPHLRNGGSLFPSVDPPANACSISSFRHKPLTKSIYRTKRRLPYNIPPPAKTYLFFFSQQSAMAGDQLSLQRQVVN